MFSIAADTDFYESFLKLLSRSGAGTPSALILKTQKHNKVLPRSLSRLGLTVGVIFMMLLMFCIIRKVKQQHDGRRGEVVGGPAVSKSDFPGVHVRFTFQDKSSDCALLKPSKLCLWTSSAVMKMKTVYFLHGRDQGVKK